MSDRIPGTTYDNPIRYRGYRVFIGDGPWSTSWNYVHEDYDGPEDRRAGVARTITQAEAEINEIEGERDD